MAESKSKSLLYFVGPKGAIEDGEIFNCIRSIRPLFLEQESLYLLILKKIMTNNHGTQLVFQQHSIDQLIESTMKS